LAKQRVEGDRALTGYAETLADGTSTAALQIDVMGSPSKRRTHLDTTSTVGAVAIAMGPGNRIFMIEAQGRSYDPENQNELRDAIVNRVNHLRVRIGAQPLKVLPALQKYAQQTADKSLRQNDFIEKDDMGRTMSGAILGDIDGLQFAGAEMFKVTGAEEVTPGATPTDKRFSLVGVGVARKKADAWWVVIFVATPEDKKQDNN
jgi:uncharacterized protein YkwD